MRNIFDKMDDKTMNEVYKHLREAMLKEHRCKNVNTNQSFDEFDLNDDSQAVETPEKLVEHSPISYLICVEIVLTHL